MPTRIARDEPNVDLVVHQDIETVRAKREFAIEGHHEFVGLDGTDGLTVVLPPDALPDDRLEAV